MPSALYYGGLSLSGPGGIGAIAMSASGQKYADLGMERPDLSFEEKMLISSTVGVAEGALNDAFKGAEKLLFNSAMRLLPSSAIKQMGKEAAKKGFAAGSLDILKKFLVQILRKLWKRLSPILIELGVENAVDKAAGRPTREINNYELFDAALGVSRRCSLDGSRKIG